MIDIIIAMAPKAKARRRAGKEYFWEGLAHPLEPEEPVKRLKYPTEISGPLITELAEKALQEIENPPEETVAMLRQDTQNYTFKPTQLNAAKIVDSLNQLRRETEGYNPELDSLTNKLTLDVQTFPEIMEEAKKAKKQLRTNLSKKLHITREHLSVLDKLITNPERTEYSGHALINEDGSIVFSNTTLEKQEMKAPNRYAGYIETQKHNKSQLKIRWHSHPLIRVKPGPSFTDEMNAHYIPNLLLSKDPSGEWKIMVLSEGEKHEVAVV